MRRTDDDPPRDWASVEMAPEAGIPHRPFLQVAVLLWVGTLWGVQPALIKGALGEGVSELAGLGLVLSAIGLTLAVALLARGQMFRLTGPVLVFMTMSAILEYAAPLLVTFIAARHVDAGLLTLIMSISPILVVAIGAALGQEPLRRETLLACLVGAAALGLLAVPQDALPSRDMLPWCLLALVAPLSYALGSLYVAKAWPEGFTPTQVAFAGSSMAGLMLAPFWLGAFADGTLAALTPLAWARLALVVAIVLMEMVFYFYLLQIAGPVFASFSSFVMIASGFVAGAVLFGERPSSWVWASVALFALSLLLVIMTPAREAAGRSR
jgi:drug/metabolite transporter (DMT)-like permease